MTDEKRAVSVTGGRSPWAAVLVAGALACAGAVLIAVGVVRSAEFCTFELGCDGESSAGGGQLAIIVLGLAALLAAPVVGAYLSRRAAAGRAATLALGAAFGVLVVAAVFFRALVDDALPAVVPALGVAGAIAVQSPSREATVARLVVLAALTGIAAALAAADQSWAIFVIVLATVPALGVADSVARPVPEPAQH